MFIQCCDYLDKNLESYENKKGMFFILWECKQIKCWNEENVGIIQLERLTNDSLKHEIPRMKWKRRLNSLNMHISIRT